MNRRDLLTSTGAGMALGFCAAVVVAAPGCAPTPAPAAERDPFVPRMELYRAEIAAYNEDPDTWDAAGKPFPWSTLHEELDAGAVAIHSPAGAVSALQELLNLDCIADGVGLVMVDAVMAFLKERA